MERCQSCLTSMRFGSYFSYIEGKQVKHCRDCFICKICSKRYTKYCARWGGQPDLCRDCLLSETSRKLKEYNSIAPNIISHFNTFTKTKAPIYLRNRKVISDVDFDKLISYLSDKTPDIWANTVIGTNADSPIRSGIMMTSDQAKRLLTDKFAQPHPDHDYMCSKFIWAISNSILLLNEMKDLHHTFNHDYREIYTLIDIEKHWQPDHMFSQNQNAGNIGPCVICSEDIYISKAHWMTCKNCHNISHIKCKFTHFFTQGTPRCEMCQIIYTSAEDAEFNYQSFILYANKTGRALTWMDYYLAKRIPG